MRIFTTKFILISLIACCFVSNAFAQIPTNDACTNAKQIISDSTCKVGGSQLINQTLGAATYQFSDINNSGSFCTFIASQDVWYKFTAKSQYPNIALSTLGTNWGVTNSTPKIQVYAGNVGSLVEMLCADNNPITPTPQGSALNIGTQYYVRVSKNNTTAPSTAYNKPAVIFFFLN